MYFLSVFNALARTVEYFFEGEKNVLLSELENCLFYLATVVRVFCILIFM